MNEHSIRAYNKLLNMSLSKDFNWFKKIELSDVKHGGVRDQKNFINPIGTIYVDSDWGHKQFREYHYESPFPYDEELSFGDIIGRNLSQEIQKHFKICFSIVYSEPTPKYMSFSWLNVVFINKDENMIQESMRRILNEETQGIDRFIDELSNTHELSDELKTFVKKFIEESQCKKIDFSKFKIDALGLALHTGVLINSLTLKKPLPFLLFVIFHEVAHQYQFKKYGDDEMYHFYLGDVTEKEAAEFMKKTEEVADEFASRKIRELQKRGLIGSFTPPQVYKNVSIQQISWMLNNFKKDMRKKNIDSPEKISEYFYNMAKSEL